MVRMLPNLIKTIKWRSQKLNDPQGKEGMTPKEKKREESHTESYHKPEVRSKIHRENTKKNKN